MPENTFVKLEHFTSAITEGAIDESRKIYEEIRTQSERALAAAEDEVLGETFRFVKSEVSKIRTQAGRLVSRKMMENKRALSLRRAEMCAECIAQVRARLAEYVKTPAYTRRLKDIAARALATLAGDCVLCLREEDMRLRGDIIPLHCPHNVEFRVGAFELGGLRAFCRSKALQVDASFDTTLEELGEHFAELIGLEIAGAYALAEQPEAIKL
jgi:vacuolar-type H+-ATPase subunit E/Vma4